MSLRRASLAPGAEKPRLLSGPKLERTLNELGVYHFHQIAQFTASNVAWVEHLRFKGRIQREGWVEHAVGLAAGRPTEFSRRYLSKSRYLSKKGK